MKKACKMCIRDRTVGFRRRNRPFVDGYGSADFAQKQYAGGGALYDFGVNHIALLLYLMGLPTPTRMSGRLYQKIAMDEQRRLESRYDVEEPSVGFVRFDNGATMDLFESWAAHLDSMDPSVLSQDRRFRLPAGAGFRQRLLDLHFAELRRG